MATPSLIELLEARIAPATFVNAFVVNYTDVDGDLVKVKSSKPIFHDDLREFTFAPAGVGEELSELLLKRSASGADLKIKVIETGASGDGAVNIGFIQAAGVDLRSVAIEGALGRILVGDDDPRMRGIGVLHVASLGPESKGEPVESSNLVFGAGLVRIDGDLTGTIETPDTMPGSIDRLFVGGDMTGSVFAQRVIIGKIKVEGDLIGSEDGGSGRIGARSIEEIVINGSVIEGGVSARKIGSVVVEGNIEGGDGDGSGQFSSWEIASFRLGGSLIGGRGESSGIITGTHFDLLKLNGSIIGGSGDRSGRIAMYGDWDLRDANIKIGGDLIGGTGAASGSVLTNGQRIVNVAVGGDVSGTSTPTDRFDYSNEHAGSIFGDRLGRVTIGGSLIAAERPDADTHVTSYAVWADDSIEKLKVGGRIEGTPNNLLGISAGGKVRHNYDPTAGMRTMTVGGSVTYAEVSVGYYALDAFSPTISFNADARIGEVRINGDLTASSITAGIHPGADRSFGTVDDHNQEREATERRSRIGSIIVGGQVTGTTTGGDAFGITAQQIRSMTIGGVAVPLKPGPGLDIVQLAPNTTDVLLSERA